MADVIKEMNRRAFKRLMDDEAVQMAVNRGAKRPSVFYKEDIVPNYGENLPAHWAQLYESYLANFWTLWNQQHPQGVVARGRDKNGYAYTTFNVNR